MLRLAVFRLLTLALACAVAGLPSTGHAQKPNENSKLDDSVAYSGISLFRTYCSTCHGLAGKGDGPMAEQLRYRPPDLTLLAERSGGHYPAAVVFQMIDGRKPLKGHGGPDMPVWGDAFKNSRDGFDEESVRGKIQAIVDYLGGIQERKPTK